MKTLGLLSEAVQRSLESLASEDKIQEKVYGKQKVYAPKQDQFSDYDEGEIKKMDSQIASLQQKLKELQDKFNQQENELKKLNSSLTTEQAQTQLDELSKKCDNYKQRLTKMKSADNHVSPEVKDQIHKNHKQSVTMWRKRKRMCTDILNSILEGYPKPKRQLIEDVGLETDEDYGVVLPSI
ncbi:homologous-pairing protein 2 homolog isoform X2 [Nematostella vectensis]|uniref:homologous-pairing protein 2 homolog isoform X2 n=1 Tax=Nematostella vectensis TaxID=45351 RepID=UPI0020778911|nr:homologous-pairing protein 2 homolog isoform X2 [Nematostella vectensis]